MDYVLNNMQLLLIFQGVRRYQGMFASYWVRTAASRDEVLSRLQFIFKWLSNRECVHQWTATAYKQSVNIGADTAYVHYPNLLIIYVFEKLQNKKLEWKL